MAKYKFLAYDLLTNVFIGELPCRDAQFGWLLNDAGHFYARVPLPHLEEIPTTSITLAERIITATEPGVTALFVERNKALIWGGLIWSRFYDQNSETPELQIHGNEFLSYFKRRLITQTKRYSSATHDQLFIARDLIDFAQAQPQGNIGIDTSGTNVVSGVKRTQDNFFYELKEILQPIADIAKLQDGFDFSVDVSWNTTTNLPKKELKLWYPRKGAPAQTSGLVFQLGKTMTMFNWPEDASRTTNSVSGIGKGEGDLAIRSQVADLNFNTRMPLLEGATIEKDFGQENLDNWVRALLDVYKQPTIIPNVTLKQSLDTPLPDSIIGSWTIGDEVLIDIPPNKDPRFPAGMSTFKRITAATVYPGDNNEETVAILVSEPL